MVSKTLVILCLEESHDNYYCSLGDNSINQVVAVFFTLILARIKKATIEEGRIDGIEIAHKESGCDTQE